MQKPKRILILTETRGGKGHIMPARAIEGALHELFPNKHRVSIVNMGDETKFAFEDFLHFIYIYTSKYIPFVLGTYRLSDTKFFMKSIGRAFYALKKKEISDLYEKFQPNLVLCNYPVWEYAFYRGLHKKFPEVPFINLNTDSSYPHYAWLVSDAQYNIVADEDTKKLYIKRGKDPARVKVLGIPVRKAFANLASSNKGIKKSPKPPYKILYLPTASDAGTILSFVKPFADVSNFELRVILGRNKTATDYVRSRIKAKNIKLIGWTDDIAEEFLDADIVISKAGGSTTQESIVMQRPMIINKIVPGQELGNVAVIKKHRLGEVCTKPKDLIATCDKILSNYSTYQHNMQAIAKPKAATDIAKFIDQIET